MHIIHGDNQISSRSHFLSLKEKAAKNHSQIVDLQSESITLNDLVSVSSSVSLLGDTNVIFIDGLFSKRPSNEKKSIIAYLEAHPEAPIFTWDDKDVSTQLKNFSPNLITKFDLPKYVFQFIDTFSLNLFDKSLSSSEPEMILGLLAKRLNELLIVKSVPNHYPSWLSTKLKSQAQKFSETQLLELNSSLLEIDYAQKTSTSPLDLASSLRLWLIKLNQLDN